MVSEKNHKHAAMLLTGALLACLPFSSVAKNLPPLALPLDLTLLVIVFLLGSFFLALRDESVVSPPRSLPLAGFIAFSGFYAASMAWSQGSAYAFAKIADLLAIDGLIFFVAFFVARSVGALKVLLHGFVFLALMFMLQVFLAIGSNPVKLLTFDVDYLAVGRLLSFSGTIALVFAIFVRGACRTLGLLIVCMSFVVTTAFLGGRAPLLGFILSAVFIFVIGLGRQTSAEDRRRLNAKRLLIGTALVAVAIAVFSTVDFAVVDRLGQLLGGSQAGYSSSVDQRLEYYSLSLEVWQSSPWIGVGAGGWPMAAGIGDSRLYPHNLVLEILCEIGVVGFFVFLAFAGSAYRNLGRALQHHEEEVLPKITKALLLNASIGALVSSALPDQRLLFLTLGLMAGLTTQDAKIKDIAKAQGI